MMRVTSAGLRNADILKQARAVQRLQRGIDLGGIEVLARRHFEIGTDRFGFDATITFDDDLGTGGLRQCRRGRDNEGRDAKQNYAEEQAGHD
jgi:hypothetical protein